MQSLGMDATDPSAAYVVASSLEVRRDAAIVMSHVRRDADSDVIREA